MTPAKNIPPRAINVICAPPLWASFAWGLAESTFFFLLPDIILGWASLAGFRSGLKSLAAILAGALVGGMALYSLAAIWPDATLQWIRHVPFVRDWMFDAVDQAYSDHGTVGMLFGPSLGIPYKVYAVLAPAHANATSFIFMSIPARIERLALSWAVFGVAGYALRRWWPLQRRSVAVAVYFLLWCGIYVLYWRGLD